MSELIRRLDEAVEHPECRTRCEAVKNVLHEVCEGGADFVPSELLRPAPDKYARRLLHMDPQGRYTVLVMVWDQGQGTLLHDHGGLWCVECVYRGRIRVRSFSMTTPPDAEVLRFQEENTIYAGVGEAGSLIPPFDHHSIENALDEPSVTLHVYGGELTWCNCFVPVEGGFKMERRELCYTA
ncbi:MAG TPA: cysteine dioxygenase family protein [Fimbriimonadaceae bacterium]|nr:cysteine dioxygenase family protein [Fimbriimonadaceae bacterium]